MRSGAQRNPEIQYFIRRAECKFVNHFVLAFRPPVCILSLGFEPSGLRYRDLPREIIQTPSQLQHYAGRHMAYARAYGDMRGKRVDRGAQDQKGL